MNAREAAFRAVHEVLYNKGYSNIVLDEIRRRHGFGGTDAAFITNIVMGTLRNSLLLDHAISLFSNIKLNKISPSVAVVLKTGAYQILFMDRVPDSAACNESVILAGKLAGSRSKNFVNAVLRNLSRGKGAVLSSVENLSGDEYLSVKYSCSMEAAARLLKQFGADGAERILEAMNQPARTCIRFNKCGEGDESEVLPDEMKIDCTKGKLARGAYYLDRGGAVSEMELFGDGHMAVQDEGAQLMGEFLNPCPGEDILDACAAPGGKTAHLSCLMKGLGTITACDIHAHRVEYMRQSLSRMNINNVRCMQMDMSVVNPKFRGMFDRVLVDAPCSGIGMAQRRPEIKLHYSEDATLYELQRKILASCAGYVKPGGTIVYGTCTLFKEENREAVDSLLESSAGYVLEEDKLILPDGMAGGFYMARIKRRK
ncbi:MAG: 16S rRNA (cytosine(967)-C(5))-methyltransferase RsmB [Clostridia bacterium]|nr:16S rRNA (cytosine(967)-C(5))-methyltransferase RsmB [Clostridia bacterium]